MSNKILSLKSAFLRPPLENGLGRYVCQLQRLTLKFCKSHGDSKGMRDFIQKDLVDFAKENPGIVVYVKPRRHRSPIIAVEYLNGDKENLSCHNISREDIIKWLGFLRTQSENSKNFRLRKLWHTETPSIQGPWTPFTFQNAEINVATFPDSHLSKPSYIPKSATEQLIDIFRQQQLSSKNKT